MLLTDDPYSITAINDVAGPVRSTADASAVPGATTLVGGTTSQLVDVRAALRHDVEHVFPLALGIVAIILALLLRALVAPIYLLIGVVLTYVATLGVITLVFINGFGFVGLDFTIPIVVYLFVMAIGTDYNILIASRLREGFEEGLPAARDVSGGHRPRLSGGGLCLTDPGRHVRLAPPHRHPASARRSDWRWPSACFWRQTFWPPVSSPPWPPCRVFHFWWPHRVHKKTATSTAELVAVPADTK